ncbi:MAG: LysR family transcriptional regulator [Hoeflea sp.]|uniref:LysR family transcriptional regulator n=1 Tax=Hoeflea sp. TaxID=1940281 RepID=UPI003EF53B02
MSVRPLPLEWVRAFEAAGRLGSFIAAAGELSVTQAAISQRIGHLEERLGVRLFLRKPRGVTLTVEGEAWLPHTTIHLRAIHQSADDLFGHGPRQVIIAASASVVQTWLVPRLTRVQTANRLEFAFSTMVLEEDYAKGSGIQIRYGSGPWPGYRAARLFDEELAPVAHPDHSHGDWRAKPRIALSGPRLGWAHWGGATGPTPHLRFDSFIAALVAAEMGAGVMLASLPLAAESLAAGRVVRLDAHSLRPPESYWLLAPPDRCSDARWRALTDAFCESSGE